MHLRRSPGIALSLSVLAALGSGCQLADGDPRPSRQTITEPPSVTAPTVPAPALDSGQLQETAASAGDPYTPTDGNGGFDVLHYGLTLQIVPASATKALAGVAQIRAKATQDLTSFDLDLTGLRVSSVKVDGVAADFSRRGSELIVKPSASVPGGSTFTVRVAYAGTPQPVNDPILGPYGWIRTPDGVAVACQPSGAHTWFPGSDHPSDKATFDFDVTVPAGLTTIANGESDGEVTAGGFTRSRWRSKDPMATYLATVTVGRFDVRKGVTPGGIPILAAADPTSSFTKVDTIYTSSAKITDEWVKVFGPYPFTSTGGIVDNASVNFALETQTRPIYGNFPLEETIIAHELAHEWFGDSVSVTQWKDIWLNEGFATYAEWMWGERTGQGTVQENFDQLYADTDAADWERLTGNPSRNQLFDKFAVYDRGAMTLHALRTKVGDDRFFAILRTWAKEHRHGNATTAQFIELASRVAGTDLSDLFQAWLSTPERPRL
ncbi:MAG: M1 family metallopeptidase [Streptosporangiaceae bacterium]